MSSLKLVLLASLGMLSHFSELRAESFVWTEKAQELARSFSLPNDNFKDPFFYTAYGAVFAQVGGYRLLKSKYRNYVDIPSVRFHEGSQEVLLYKHSAKVADLVIALPGLATTARSPMMNRALDFFSNRGYHTVVIANSWSPSYMKAGPRHLPGDVLAEAEAILDLVRGAVAKIGRKNIGKVHIYGESYGAFLASVAAAVDASSFFPVIDASVTLAGLPLDLRQAAKNLDALVYAAQTKKVTPLSFARLFWDFLKDPAAEHAQTPIQNNLDDLIAIGVFRKHLATAMENLDKTDASVNIESFERSRSNPHWVSYMEEIGKVKTRDKLPKGSTHAVSYWLDLLEAKRPGSFKIISSEDEFLNTGLNWGSYLSQQDRLILLEHGGHLGYQGLPLWEHLLDEAYGPRLPGLEKPMTIAKRLVRKQK